MSLSQGCAHSTLNTTWPWNFTG